MAKRKQEYTNESITALKGADRVRKRPAVIFGSDGLEGCQHSVFEILSNSIDEAREGHGDRIIVTRYPDPRSRSRTLDAAFRWILTRTRTATTGSWCSANYMRAGNTRTRGTRTMSFPWD